MAVLELAGCIASELGEGQRAARPAGAADALRELSDMPISPEDAEVLEGYPAPACAATAPTEWEAGLAAARTLTQQESRHAPALSQPWTRHARLTRKVAP